MIDTLIHSQEVQITNYSHQEFDMVSIVSMIIFKRSPGIVMYGTLQSQV